MDGLAHAHRIGSTNPPIRLRIDQELLRVPQDIARLVKMIVDVIRKRLLCQEAGTRGTTIPSPSRAPTLDDRGMAAAVRSRMTRLLTQAHASRLATDAEIEARIEMKSTRAGVNLRGLVRARDQKGGEITAEDQQESQHPEADLRSDNEARQANEDWLRRARLAMDEVGKKAGADPLVEPGLLADQGSLVGSGLQVKTGIHVNVGITMDREPDAQ
jgi:hypothetical protein